MQHDEIERQGAAELLAAPLAEPDVPCDRWSRDEPHQAHTWMAPGGPGHCPGQPAEPVAILPTLFSDPWPDDDEDILTDGYARHGVTLTDPHGYVRGMRDQQAAGLPYRRPTHAERALAAMWDEVFRRRADRGELTGTAFDREVLARRDKIRVAQIIAESEHLQARRRRTVRRLIIMWSLAVIGLAIAGAVAEKGLNA